MKDLVLLSLPDLVLTHPLMYFPLSLMYLGAMTREAGYDVQIVDCRDGIKNLPESRFYGFSCVTPQISEAKKIARIVGKERSIIGGAHASLLPLDCVHDFNYVVRGEGEYTLLDILSGKQTPGIIDSPRIKNLDILPFPAWDMVDQPFSDTLFPGERYGNGELASTLIGSRGCPYTCSFCGNVHSVPVVYRSAKSIFQDLHASKKPGANYFRFEDDCFALNPQFDSVCRLIKQLAIHYKGHTRSDLVTPQNAALLVWSGGEECGLGVESADPHVLRVNNKKETVDDHKKAIKMLKDAGLRVKAYFVTGLPGETAETIELNKQFVLDTKIDKWTVSTFCPYPGTPIFKSPGKFGIEIMENDFSKWWNFSENYNHIIIGQTRSEMWQRYLDFYSWLKERDES